MIRPSPAGLLVLFGQLACSAQHSNSTQRATPADLVLRGATVYTVDAARSWASVVAIRDGRIAYVGSDSLPPGL
ncbi:MAG TPA: hypothetical protein VIM84_02225, partial [Gemmatimonadales bacterium]